MAASLLSALQGEFGSGLHRVDRGAGAPASTELQADGDPEEGFAGTGQSRLAPTPPMINSICELGPGSQVAGGGGRISNMVERESQHL